MKNHSACHHSISNIRRHDRRSTTAAAAYRTGLCISDERLGERHDYTAKKGVLSHFNIGWPDSEGETANLWNAVEKKDTNRTKINLARETTLALPHELPHEEQERLVKSYALWLRDRYGVALTCAIHAPDTLGDQRNHHAHILWTTREVAKDGTIGPKVRRLDDKKTGSHEYETMRQEWAKRANRVLERHGVEARIDPRSHDRKHIYDNAPPQVSVPHLGPAKTAIKRKWKREAKEAIASNAATLPPMPVFVADERTAKKINGLYRQVHKDEAALGIHAQREDDERALAAESKHDSTTSLWDAIGSFSASGFKEYAQSLINRLRTSTAQPAATRPSIRKAIKEAAKRAEPAAEKPRKRRSREREAR